MEDKDLSGVTKKEDVIRTLTNCSSDDHDCTKCSYFKYDDCIDYLMMDAAQLLKTQEPRMLTLEEVQNDCPDYVYLETSTGWLGYCIKDEGESDKYVGYLVYGFDEYFIERWKEYGKTWRCWTAMPTDEQRKAVK